MHGRSRMTIDPRIPTLPGRSTFELGEGGDSRRSTENLPVYNIFKYNTSYKYIFYVWMPSASGHTISIETSFWISIQYGNRVRYDADKRNKKIGMYIYGFER